MKFQQLLIHVAAVLVKMVVSAELSIPISHVSVIVLSLELLVKHHLVSLIYSHLDLV